MLVIIHKERRLPISGLARQIEQGDGVSWKGIETVIGIDHCRLPNDFLDDVVDPCAHRFVGWNEHPILFDGCGRGEGIEHDHSQIGENARQLLGTYAATVIVEPNPRRLLGVVNRPGRRKDGRRD